MRFTILIFFVMFYCGSILAQPPVQAPGWLGVGDGVFPDYAGPYRWDAQTGKNILWKATLPNWSNSSPVVADQPVCL